MHVHTRAASNSLNWLVQAAPKPQLSLRPEAASCSGSGGADRSWWVAPRRRVRARISASLHLCGASNTVSRTVSSTVPNTVSRAQSPKQTLSSTNYKAQSHFQPVRATPPSSAFFFRFRPATPPTSFCPPGSLAWGFGARAWRWRDSVCGAKKSAKQGPSNVSCLSSHPYSRPISLCGGARGRLPQTRLPQTSRRSPGPHTLSSGPICAPRLLVARGP